MPILNLSPVCYFFVELYELSDGRVLSPVPIEMAVKEQLPFLGHAVAVGHQRPYLVMLFTFQVTAQPTVHQSMSYSQTHGIESK